MYIEKRFNELQGEELTDYRLCYVEKLEVERDTDGEPTAYGWQLYFTSIPLTDQWGDDWDDAPYNCNAGEPYDSHYVEDVRKEHTLIATEVWVKANHWMLMPEDYAYNTPYAVADINSGAVAWLFLPASCKCCDGVAVHAGMTPEEVKWKIGHILIDKPKT